MISSLSAQIALFAFAAAIVAGIAAGNSPTTILTRALIAMFVASIVGKFAGWSTKLVLRDHLQRKKLAIDKRHVVEREALKPQEEMGNQAETVTQAVQ